MFFYNCDNFGIFSLSCVSVFSNLHFLVSELCRRLLSAVNSINLAVQNVILKFGSSTKYCISADIHNIYPEIIYCSIVGHVQRMEENRISKRVLYMNLETIRPRGRPRNRWLDEVREDGRMVGGEEWQEKVYDREE